MTSLLSARGGGVGLGQFAGLCDTGAIWQLEDHLKQCIHSRDYGAASHVDAQIQHLKQQQEGHALETLAAQQAEDRAGNEAAFAQARQELAQKWQERMSHMQEQLMINRQQLLARHEEETASLLAAQMNTPARPRFTPQLLNMRRVERNLAEQRNFSKANKVKQQAGQQELLELQCWDAEKLGKWELERAGLAAQHAREQAAADKKVASAMLEAQLVQQQELEQLTRRFQAAQLAMSRTHAAQQVKAATILRSTLAIPRASSLMSLPSFNTSLAPPRGLVAPLPLNPAETCRPAHLFEETLPPAPNQGAVQPLMPTLLAGTPGFNDGPVTSQYGSYHKGGLGVNPSSSSLANGRGGSPTRCAQGMYARNVSTPRGGGRAAQDGMQWGGGSILTSGNPNLLARGGPNAPQPGGGSRGGSPTRSMQPMSHQHGPNSSSSSRAAASPARNIQPVSQVAAAYGSSSSHERCASPIKGARRAPDTFSPAAPSTPVPGPSPPTSGANRAALSPNRAGSPSRMPHPPCPCPPSSGSSDRPHSPAVRIRARSPQKAPAGAAANTACAPSSVMMAPSIARFHSPSRGRPAPPMQAQAGRLEAASAPVAQGPYAVPQPQLVHLASRKGAGGPLGVARMSDGMMGAGLASLQVGPAQQHLPEPPAPKAELSSEQKQWLGQNMQRLQSMVNGLDVSEDCLSPPSAPMQVPAAASAAAAVQPLCQAVQEPASVETGAAGTVQAVCSDRDDSLAAAFVKQQRLLEEQEQQAQAEAAAAADAAALQQYDRLAQEAVAQPSEEVEAAAGVLQQQVAPGFSAAGVDELVETVAAWAGGDH